MLSSLVFNEHSKERRPSVEGLLASTFLFYLNAGRASTVNTIEAEKAGKVMPAGHTLNLAA
jgi:hypothetical protein